MGGIAGRARRVGIYVQITASGGSRCPTSSGLEVDGIVVRRFWVGFAAGVYVYSEELGSSWLVRTIFEKTEQ